MDGVYKHPLFLEFGIIKTSSRIARTRSTALIWREMREKGRKIDEAEVVGDPAYNNLTMVFSNGGSSFGDVSVYYFIHSFISTLEWFN